MIYHKQSDLRHVVIDTIKAIIEDTGPSIDERLSMTRGVGRLIPKLRELTSYDLDGFDRKANELVNDLFAFAEEVSHTPAVSSRVSGFAERLQELRRSI